MNESEVVKMADGMREVDYGKNPGNEDVGKLLVELDDSFAFRARGRRLDH